MKTDTEKPHVHGEWTDIPSHRHCHRAGWCCTRCGWNYGTDPRVCGRCDYTVFAPLWTFDNHRHAEAS